MAKKKSFSYFEEFVVLVDYSCKCAEILNEVLNNYDCNNMEKQLEKLHEIEHSADLRKHQVTTQLIKEFLPPIEREDIISLTHEIDDITDTIEDVLIKIHMFNIQTIKPEVLEFASLIMKCANALKVAFEEFPNYKKSKILRDKIIEVNNLEEEGDRLYYKTVRDLHVNSKDPLELLIWTKIYAYLERCCDACEEVADILETIVMKNS